VKSWQVVMNILRLFFSFYGRISRAKYWTGWAVSYAVIAAAMASWAFLPSSDAVSGAVGLICLTCVFTLIPIAVKRLHDLDITGWWVAVFVTVYAFAMAPPRSYGDIAGERRLVNCCRMARKQERGPERQSARTCSRLSEHDRLINL